MNTKKGISNFCCLVVLQVSCSLAAVNVTNLSDERLPEGVRRVAPAELKIERKTITPLWIDHPLPQGPVDVNPPWLHVSVPILDGNEKTNPERKTKRAEQKWNRRFYFRLSKDPEFKKGVIESGPKRWSFYNPYRRLELGTWYWKYGVARAETPDKPVWSDKSCSFTISGKEFVSEIPPTPEALLIALKKRNSGPRVVCLEEEIGALLPTKANPGLATRIMQDCEKAFTLLSATNVVRVREEPESKKEPKSLLERKQASSRALVESRRIYSLLRGYLFTGEQKYKALALQHLKKESRGQKEPPKEFIFERPLGGKLPFSDLDLFLVDVLYNELPRSEQFRHAQAIYGAICDEGSRSPDMHDMLEHMLYDNHAWQGAVPALFKGSIALSRINPEFEEWVKYTYELYLYRAPAFSRTDGGSSEGNGYLGVHEDHLVAIPWLIYKLTGYNFYKNSRWFGNFGNYMALARPVGNPGISFEDAGEDGGASMHYLSEMLARLCPENSSNLWQWKSVGRRSDQYYSADLSKGAKAWDMLSVWQRTPEADLSKAIPPVERAAAFGDVGLVCMHTDLTQATNNLMLNFRAGPYGSEGHTHPAQNAFTLAYGGQPLFWRTGYYNGGGLHNIFSYKSSRAHNTIIADGLVQGFHQSAYAWIARFATGERISYALGDASNAYIAKHHYFDLPYRPGLKDVNKVEARRNWKAGIPENGFGDPGVTRFRRHVVMLRPYHVLIYDELEAKNPITWTFQLHSRLEMKQMGDAWFKTANASGLGTARLFCSAPLKGELTDKFKGIPVDEENKRNGQNPPNWHATITTRDRLAATRFLAVLEVHPEKGLSATPVEPVAEGAGKVRIRVGDYSVVAELDPTKPSFLDVKDNAGTCGLVTGQGAEQLILGGRQKSTSVQGATLLWEPQSARGEILLEKKDELPDCLKYGNQF